MERDELLRRQLLELLNGGNAHMPFEAGVADFPIEGINEHPPRGEYTPWRLLEHMRIAQWDILEFVRNPKYVSPEWPAGYWPAERQKASKEQWDETINRFMADLKAFQDIIKDPKNGLISDIPHAPGYTLLREAMVLADHNAFHLGEFCILREVMGTWRRG